VRIDAIIPVAAQAKSAMVTTPTSPDGAAMSEIAVATSCRLATLGGRARTTVSTTASCTSRFPSSSPNTATTTMASGTIENSTR
jgi:hypothetical protein